MDGNNVPSNAKRIGSYDEVFQPAVLPCGRVITNRLVKVAMYEHLATFSGGPPNTHHLNLYSEWAKHDWGMVITGNVQVAPDHLTLGRDLVVPTCHSLSHPSQGDLEPFRRLADAIHGLHGSEDMDATPRTANHTLAIMQLNHPGRQSSSFIGGRLPLQPPLGPSALRLGEDSGQKKGFMEGLVNKLMFQTPQEMTEADVREAMDSFVHAAVFAHKAGFDGVQLHVAHGYLLAQFLSANANKRQDAYSYDKALDMIRTVIEQIRSSTPKDFVACIKLNAADYTDSSLSSALTDHEQRALQHLLEIARWGTVDVIEISGGDYEKPVFMETPTSDPSTGKSSRQAFFARFSQQALTSLSTSPEPPLILLTGGLRTPALLRTALASKHADLLGIGRAAVLSPDIPTLLHHLSSDTDSPSQDDSEDLPFRADPDLRTPAVLSLPPFSWLWAMVPKVKLIGAGVGMAWYIVAMRRFADPSVSGFALNRKGSEAKFEPNYNVGGLGSVFWMWAWVPSSSSPSREKDSGQRMVSVVVVVLATVLAVFLAVWGGLGCYLWDSQ